MSGVIIEQGGFRLEQCGDESDLFDFYQKKLVNHKDGTSDAEWKIRAYGVPFNKCVDMIIRILTAHTLGTKVPDFKEYLQTYRDTTLEVIKIFNLSVPKNIKINDSE